MNQSFITGLTAPAGMAVTALETDITQGPAGAIGRSGATFSFRSSEPAGFDCRLDNQPFAACGSPKTYSSLANGRHSFQVRAHDAAGNVDPTPATRSWSVNAVAPATADTTKPVLGALRLSRSVFAAAPSGPSIKAKQKIDTKISYRLTEPASVRFQILRRNAGRTVSGRCRPLTRANRGRKKCDLPLKGSPKHQGARGTNGLRFRGRLRGRKLSPGRYRLVATATDADNNHSSRKQARFRIVTR